MPPAGQSGLPDSLAQVVPEPFRYWTLRGEAARKSRSALIDSGFFTKDNVAFVDGVLQKVEVKVYRPDPHTLYAQLPDGGSKEGIEQVFDKFMPICKSVQEERYILAVVLEPRTAQSPDLQKEYYSAKTIRNAMYRFMEYVAKGLEGSQQYGAGIEHKRNVLGNPITANDKMLLVENYIAPITFKIVDPDGVEQTVNEGTWLQGWRLEPTTWSEYKSGIFKGLSIDGDCWKRKVKKVSK